MKKTLFAVILALIFILPLPAQDVTKSNSPARKAADNLTAAQLKDYLYFVASDEMEGRDTPSRGLDTTAKFIATMLSRWGVKPAGDNGSYFQKINLHREAVDEQKTSFEMNGQKLLYGEDIFRLSGSGNASAPLAYGRDGWFVKAKNIDALEGVDVKGKIVVLAFDGFPNQRTFSPLPKGVQRSDLQGKPGEDFALPMAYAKAKGAVGIIIVASKELQAGWEQVRGFFRGGAMSVEGLQERRAADNFPVFLVSQKVGTAIFAGETANPLKTDGSIDTELKGFALSAAKTVALNAVTKDETLTTQNVVGIIEGSDPTLKNEYVAIGAHYDHIGISQNATGTDKINNGADDDGSGTVSILSIAEAIAKSPKKPKRSVLFVWHCGEEKGLWGSAYFTKFPTVPIEKITAQFNIDMIGRSKKSGDANPLNKDLSGENQVFVIGSTMMSSKLGEISDSVNKTYLNLDFDKRYDDPKDTNRFFFRSDHFNYAQRGIPIIFYFDGVHEDYHKVGDEPQKIDYNKMEKIARTVMLTMWETADLKERPKIDKELPAELKQAR